MVVARPGDKAPSIIETLGKTVQAELDKFTGEIRQLERDVAKLRADKDAAESGARKAQEARAYAEEDIKVILAKKGEATREVEEHEASCRARITELNALVEVSEKELKQIRKNCAQALTEATEATEALREAQESLSAIRAQQERATADYEATIGRQEETIGSYEGRLRDAKDEYEKFDQDSRVRITELEEIKVKLTEECEALEVKANEARASYNYIAEQHDKKSIELEKFNKYIATTKREVEEGKRFIARKERELADETRRLDSNRSMLGGL